jgi:hypothetical protein
MSVLMSNETKRLRRLTGNITITNGFNFKDFPLISDTIKSTVYSLKQSKHLIGITNCILQRKVLQILGQETN